MDHGNLVDFLFGNKKTLGTKEKRINDLTIRGSLFSLIGLLIIMENISILTSFLIFNQSYGILGIENIVMYYPFKTIFMIIGLIITFFGFSFYDKAVKESSAKLGLFHKSSFYLILGIIFFLIFLSAIASVLNSFECFLNNPGYQPYISNSQTLYMAIFYLITILFILIANIALTFNLFKLSKTTKTAIFGVISPLFLIPFLNIAAALILLVSSFTISIRSEEGIYNN